MTKSDCKKEKGCCTICLEGVNLLAAGSKVVEIILECATMERLKANQSGYLNDH